MEGQCPICEQSGAERSLYATNLGYARRRCPRCGDLVIEELCALGLGESLKGTRYLLSAAARAASDAERPLTITDANLTDIIATVPKDRTLFERVDRVVVLFAARSGNYGAHPKWQPSVDYPLLAARDANEAQYLVDAAIHLGYVDPPITFGSPPSLTVAGWQRADELRQLQPDSRQAFVAMWFDKQMDAAWTEGFKPGIEDSKYFAALRIDTVNHNGKIDDRIVAEIRRSGLVVADFTGNRGGVYFEAGLAQGLGIPVIWTCRKDGIKDLHFDTRQFNHIEWENPSELRAKLHDRIAATVLPSSAVRR